MIALDPLRATCTCTCVVAAKEHQIKQVNENLFLI